MKKKNKDLSPGDSLITALKEAVDYEKGKPQKGTRSRKISIAPVPHYTGKKIRAIRNDLRLSQFTFAHVLGVSVKTVEAWESGRNEPQGPARRLLFLLETDSTILEKYNLVSSA